jgi:hypothetical protein
VNFENGKEGARRRMKESSYQSTVISYTYRGVFCALCSCCLTLITKKLGDLRTCCFAKRTQFPNLQNGCNFFFNNGCRRLAAGRWMKNKPNSKPIRSQNKPKKKPIQTQTNPMHPVPLAKSKKTKQSQFIKEQNYCK